LSTTRRVRHGGRRTASGPEAVGRVAVPRYLCRVPAGFPSPAGDYVESNIDFNEWLVRNEPSTFVVRVEGDSMEGLIHSGDWLVVDRSLEPRHRDIVVAKLGGEVTVKRLLLEGGRPVLAAENPAYQPVGVEGDQELAVWGVVTYCIRRLR
jgi:DNA polymerase V